MTRRHLALAGVVALLVGASARATQRLGTSPHGQPDACAACHATTPEGERGPPMPVLATCRGCHPDADMHPVGMAPDQVKVREGWPLEDGLVTCATCHAEPGCASDRDPTRPWLRGGTPERKADFCFRCHESTALKRQSPHLAEGASDPSQAGCPACHTRRPEPGAAVADAALRVAPGEVCATCHPGPLHAGADEHVGKVMWNPPTGPQAAARPLGPGNTVGCWTCHEVHGAPHAAPAPSRWTTTLSGGRADLGRDALLALPAADGSLCRACHGDGP